MFGGGYQEFQNVWDSIIKLGYFKSKENFHKLKDKNFSKEKKIYYQILESNFINWEIDRNGINIAESTYNESKKTENKICELDAGLNFAIILYENFQIDQSLQIIGALEFLIKKIGEVSKYLKQREIILLHCKSRLLTVKGELDQAERIALHALELNKGVDFKLFEYHICNTLTWIKTPQGKFDEIKQNEYYKLEIAKKMESQALIAYSYDNLAAIHQWRGEYDTALEYIYKTIEIREELDFEGGVMMARTRLALHHWYVGELDTAVEILNETIPWRLKHKDKRMNCFGNWNKSLVEWYKGELDEAIISCTKAVDYAIEMGDKMHQDTFSIFLAAIYFDKGEYDKSLELCLESKKDARKFGENFHIAFANYVIAMVYHVWGKLDLAWQYAQQSLKIRKEMKITHHIIESLFSLIQIVIDKNDIVQAKSYQSDLEEIVYKNPRKRFLLIEKIARGMILKASSKPRSWIKAIDIFLEIAKEETVTHSLTVIALIQLCELLIREFSMSGEPEILLELENYTEQLEDIARIQKNYKLRIEACHIRILTLWLKAQYSIADIDIKRAKELLINAREMADEEGLILLAEKIIRQQGQLNDRIDKWDGFIRKYYEFLKE